jgi:FtsP/CotA-like multicopper oxidase with cupredoxin domain
VVLAAVVVAVVAFVVARSGGGDDKGDSGAGVSSTRPVVEKIQIRGSSVVGGSRQIRVVKGDRVRITVTADAANVLHLHGYDIEKKVLPARPAHFDFDASIEGQFELESHTFEDAGRPPRVANVVVEPS